MNFKSRGLLKIFPKVFLLVIILATCVGRGYAADLTIYSDSLASGWENWSWDTTINVANTSPVHGDSGKSISVRFDQGWASLYLHGAVDTSEYESLSFWINGGASGGQQIRIVANGNNSQTYAVTAQAGTWTHVNIPFSDLGSPSSLSDIYWQDSTGGSQPVFYLDDITLIAAPPQPPPTLSIDANAGRHPISSDIYGMNYADEQLAAELHLPVRRWGGNSTSRYNWQANIYNTGSDWYFENIPAGANVTNGSASDLFVEQDRRTGTKTLMTVPLIGWVSKDTSPRYHPYDCGFKVSNYGSQQSVDEWDTDCGNGVYSSGGNITGNSASDTSSAIDATFVRDWINHLTARYGTATNGGVAYYNLDNEPMLWNSTHRDIHPQAATYNELRDSTYQYAAAVKSADPTAKTLGPVLWGWCAYFYSALDGCQPGTDYQTHGNSYFVPWYLQQMNSYEQQNGIRILDYLDLHYYPQADGVSLSSAGNTATQALRLRSTRSLWDPTYTDESWIPDAVRLIPRMRDWVTAGYPGTKLAITEYNWGGLESINGALAQADVLGIFGREGLDLATLWGPPESSQPGAFAFRIYRNYDGADHGFGETGVQSVSSNQGKLSVYAAQRTSDNALTVVVINKTGNDLLSPVTLAGFAPQPAASAYRYSAASLGAIQHLADQAVTAGGFSATFPANSITLYIIPSVPSGSHTLTVTRSGTGSGDVTADQGTIVWNGNIGTAVYQNGSDVTLTATPIAGSGSAFYSWSGDCSGSVNPCPLKISSDTSVDARFDLVTDFSGAPTFGSVPLHVCFTDASTDAPTSWLWDFGDGSGSSSQNPCHGYRSIGAFDVSLATGGGGGGSMRTKENYITTTACVNQPVRIEAGGAGYPTLQEAIDHAIDGDTILVQALDFDEDVSTTGPAALTLKGGYGCDFTTTPMQTEIKRSLTVGEGSIVFDGISIR